MCVHTYVCECFEDTLLSFQVYATCEFTVAPVHNPYHHTEEVVYYTCTMYNVMLVKLSHICGFVKG